MAPQGEQYISVVPIQNSAGGIQGPNNGAYAYVQPDGQSGGHQAYAIINPSATNPVPAMGNRSGNRDAPEKPRSNKTKDKNKSRRSERHAGKKSDSKHQQGSSHSTLLEDFKAKKNRNWTALDIKGTFFFDEKCPSF